MDLNKLAKRYGGLTEEYKFYNGEVTLRYDVKDHKYFLITPDGLEEQDGVTDTCHIIDKSQVLMNWAVKVMARQILDDFPMDAYPDSFNFGKTQSISRQQLEQIVLDAKKAKDEHLEDAGAVGNVAHNWIEQYIKALLRGYESPALPEEPRAKSCCEAMLGWTKAHNVRFLQTERKVYSRRYKYAGTMDGLAWIDSCTDPKCCPKEFKDRLSIVDWKTSNYLYIEYLYQTAAYQHAWMEMMSVEDPHGALVTDRWVIRLGKDDAEFDPWHMELEEFDLDFSGFRDCLALSRNVAKLTARIGAKETAEKLAARAERKAAREAQEASQGAERSRIRAEKRQERVDALAKACKASGKYKGRRKPTCDTNNGAPCEKCLETYERANKERQTKAAQVAVKADKTKMIDVTRLLNKVVDIRN